MNLPTVLVLASGRGERFAASGATVPKLQALLSGKALLQHTLSAVQGSGLPWHLEEGGHPGMGDSIAAAVRATQDASGWLVLPGDLPLIQSVSLQAVALALAHHAVVVPQYLGQRGHPVGFGRQCRQALLGLSGDRGAASVVRAYAALELVLHDRGCVTDIDTLDDLRAAQRLMDGT